jgi:hypothetical protein
MPLCYDCKAQISKTRYKLCDGYCERCWSARWFICPGCDDAWPQDERHTVHPQLCLTCGDDRPDQPQPCPEEGGEPPTPEEKLSLEEMRDRAFKAFAMEESIRREEREQKELEALMTPRWTPPQRPMPE